MLRWSCHSEVVPKRMGRCGCTLGQGAWPGCGRGGITRRFMTVHDVLLNWISILMPLAGVAGLAFLVSRGFLRPRSLDGAPPRPAGLGLVELLAITGIFLLTQASVMSVLNYSGLGMEPAAVPPVTAPEIQEPPESPKSPATSAIRPATMAASAPAAPPTVSPSALGNETPETPETPGTPSSGSGIPALPFKSGADAASTRNTRNPRQ